MIYVDNNATTQMAPEVLQAMEPYLTSLYGNPSSLHQLGQLSKKAIEEAREKVASFLGTRHESEIIFTSGGTESNNLAIRGLLKARPIRRHLITTAVEHPSVLKVFKDLEGEGYRVTYVRVDPEGNLDLDALRRELSDDTALVSVMAANNETGVMFPVEEIGQWVKGCGAYFHVDAVQSAGRILLSLERSVIDFLSISGHKLHAPKGVGALYAKKGSPLTSLFMGGSQERDRRAGTENVASVVGLARACELAAQDFEIRNQSLARLRNRLEEGLLSRVPEVAVNGNRRNRVSNTTNLTFKEVDSESILLALNEEGICASSGSACSTGSIQLSHVLLAMGYSEDHVRGAIRFSLSRYNREEEIDFILATVPGVISRLRALQASGV